MALAALVTCLLMLQPQTARAVDGDTVSIPDLALGQCIYADINRISNRSVPADSVPPDGIYKFPREKLLSLDRLDCMTLHVKDLSGLQHAASLKWLVLDGPNSETLSNTVDVSSLSQLNTLEKLDFYSTKPKSLEPLINLEKLKHFTVTDGGAMDLAGLERLTSLERLDLINSEIHDISPLKGLKNLEMLQLTSNKIKDLGPLSDLPQLTDLYLNENNIEEISPLNKLPSLTAVHLEQNRITNISPVRNLLDSGQLVFLDVDHQRVELPSTKVGSIIENPIRDSNGENVQISEFEATEVPDVLVANESDLGKLVLGWDVRQDDATVSATKIYFSGKATVEILPADLPIPRQSPLLWVATSFAVIAAAVGIVWWRRRPTTRDTTTTAE